MTMFKNKIRQLGDTTIHSEGLSNVNTNLNPSQKQALAMASSQVLTLIQAPPGTGRTVTTVEIVAEWLRI